MSVPGDTHGCQHRVKTKTTRVVLANLLTSVVSYEQVVFKRLLDTIRKQKRFLLTYSLEQAGFLLFRRRD